MYYKSTDNRVWIAITEDEVIELIAPFYNNLPHVLEQVRGGAYIFLESCIIRYSA